MQIIRAHHEGPLSMFQFEGRRVVAACVPRKQTWASEIFGSTMDRRMWNVKDTGIPEFCLPEKLLLQHGNGIVFWPKRC